MHGHSGGALPGPISNPEVKPSCVGSGTVVRKPTGKTVAVPLSFISPQQILTMDVVNLGAKMPISTGDILGHSQVGVYLSVVGDVLFIPSTLEEEIATEIDQSFDVESHRITIGGSALLGSLISGNKKGLAVADIATQDDLDELSSFGDVVILESGVNAAGNLIECNDKGACLLYTSPSPRDRQKSRMPSSA